MAHGVSKVHMEHLQQGFWNAQVLEIVDIGHLKKRVWSDAKVRILDIPEQNVQGEEDRWNDPIGTAHLENQACIQRCAKHPWGRPSVSLPKKFVADPFCPAGLSDQGDDEI